MNLHIPGIGWHAHIFVFFTGIAIVYIYRMCDEKCSDNDAINHNGGYTMQSYAHSRGSFQDHRSASPSIAKPMLAIILAGALTTCGTFYFLHKATSKPQSSQASAAASIATRPAQTCAGSNLKKANPAQKYKQSKTHNRRHSGHKRTAIVS